MDVTRKMPAPDASGGRSPCCVVCGATLTVHQQVTNGTCADRQCRWQKLKQDISREAHDIEAIRQNARRVCGNIATARDIANPESMPLGILPSNERRLTNLPAGRYRVFRDYLTDSISRAAVMRYGVPDPIEQQGAEESLPDRTPRETAVLAQACTLCRGECCVAGGEHAFLRPGETLRYMLAHPNKRPRHILADYLGYLAPKTFEGACIYQGLAGCTLPRSMRASLCNAHHCRPLCELYIELRRTEASLAFLAATSDGKIMRTAIADAPS